MQSRSSDCKKSPEALFVRRAKSVAVTRLNLPVFALTLAAALVASCSKQAEAPAPAATEAPAASTQPAQSAGQTTNFEDNTQTQAPAPPAAPTS